MSFCPNCGVQVDDNTVYCPNCGAPVASQQQPQPQQNLPYQQPYYAAQPQVQLVGIKKVIHIFLIIGVICTAISTCAIGLAWCLPIKNKYQRLVAAGQPVPVGLKVCTLIFVSLIAGILMLTDHN